MKIYEISHKNKFFNKLKHEIPIDLDPQFNAIDKLRSALNKDLIAAEELGNFEELLFELEENLLADIERFKNYEFADMLDTTLKADYLKHDSMKNTILQNRGD